MAAEQQNTRSGSPSNITDEEDDLDRRIAEVEFLLAREQALNAARTVYRTALAQLSQPSVVLTTDSVSAALVAGCGNQDELSAAELERGPASSRRTLSARATTSKQTHPPSQSDKATTPHIKLKQPKPLPPTTDPHKHWTTFWLPLLLCLSILTVPAEWAAITHGEMRPNPTFQRLVFQVVAQIILSFLGICCPLNLTPSLTALHRILKASVLCSWILSGLSYTRTLRQVAEQELALLLSFFRMTVSMDIFTVSPPAALSALALVTLRCLVLVPQLSITLQPSHLLIAAASAALSPCLLHHLSTYMQTCEHPAPKADQAHRYRDSPPDFQRLCR